MNTRGREKRLERRALKVAFAAVELAVAPDTRFTRAGEPQDRSPYTEIREEPNGMNPVFIYAPPDAGKLTALLVGAARPLIPYPTL